MRVGIVSINSHAHMPAQMHFEEQIIYTFQAELAGEVQLAGAVLDFTRGNETFLTSS